MDDTPAVVLIVDDNVLNIEALKRILFPHYTVLTAKSGKECLISAVANKPELILLDIKISGTDSYEIIRILKNTPSTNGIPIIITTANDNEKEEERGFAVGAVDYIVSPFRTSTVLARVKIHVQIVRQLKTIERLSLEDPLTGIPNRRRFDWFIDAEWARAIRNKTTLSFMMIDIDKFKKYNDTYGHQQGDILLKTLANHLESFARRSSDLLVRLGGEEFGLLLSLIPPEKAVKMAESIRSTIEDMRIPYRCAKKIKTTKTTVSIGVHTMSPSIDNKPYDLIAVADEYLYIAKKEGRNRVIYEKKAGYGRIRRAFVLNRPETLTTE